MRETLKRILAPLLLAGLLASVALAQPSAQARLDEALAIAEPAERIEALQQFIKSGPEAEAALAAREEVVRSYAELASRELAANNVERALFNFRRALGELPAKISDRFYEETVARMPLAISVRGYRAEAILLARDIEGRFDREPLRLAALGEFYLNLEAPGEAARALESAVKISPDEPRLHRALATAYRMNLRLDESARAWQRAIDLDARDGRAWAELANLRRALGDYAESIRLYERQLEIDPSDRASRKGLALARLGQGDERGFEAELGPAAGGSAEELNRDLYLQTQLAFYHLAQHRVAAAQTAVNLALAIEPRYSWARMAAAEVDLAEGRYFEAERHLLTALRFADFPTLRFTLGKIYLGVEDFDGALEQFGRAFSLTRGGKFATKLGGVLETQADGLRELLDRERQAAIYVAEPPTTEEQFKLAAALFVFDARLRAEGTAGTPARRSRAATFEAAANDFVEAEGGRRAFRALYVAGRLAQSGHGLPLAIKLADLALDLAEAATEAEGSVREYPNYDRDGRLRLIRGRALDARGWALFRQGRNREAIASLTEAVVTYGLLPENKRALWHLATVKEVVGEQKEALDLYFAGYEPPAAADASSDTKRAVIAVLYRKVHGSLDGLDERLGRPAIASTTEPAPVVEESAKTPAAPPAATITALPEAATADVMLAPMPAGRGRRYPAPASMRIAAQAPPPEPSASSSTALTTSISTGPPEAAAVTEPEAPPVAQPVALPRFRQRRPRLTFSAIEPPLESPSMLLAVDAPEPMASTRARRTAPAERPRRTTMGERPRVVGESAGHTRRRRVNQ